MQTTKLQGEEGNFAQHIYLHFISHLYIYYSFLFAKAYNNSCNANLMALFRLNLMDKIQCPSQRTELSGFCNPQTIQTISESAAESVSMSMLAG